MSFKLNFITNDESIRSYLSQSINESPNDRIQVSTFIPNNFCRNIDNLVGTVRDHMKDAKNTIIFVNGGNRVLGLIIFKTISRPVSAIMVEVICVPETGEKGTGIRLLNKVKELAKTMGLTIYLTPIDESIKFYTKNGFKPFEGGYYTFSASTSTSGGKRKTRTSRKARKARKAKTRKRVHKFKPVA
jgi:hypothetical protein